MNNKTGGQAFPRISHTNCHGIMLLEEDGMSLGDYFAAKAMQAIVSNPNASGLTFEEISQRAWLQADAMLKERNKNV